MTFSDRKGLGRVGYKSAVHLAALCMMGAIGISANACAAGGYASIHGAQFAPSQSEGTVVFRVEQNQQNYLDLAQPTSPAFSSATIWSPIPQAKEIGREEAFYRRADHRVPA